MQTEKSADEIVVTGIKRDRSLHDLAQSAAVLTGTWLEETGALRLDDYWRTVPSLNVYDAAFGGDTVIIRGLADTDNFQQPESMNAFYFDDTAITHVEGLFATPGDPTLIDIERIEVFRGPQGSTMGANAMGGAVRVVSREPVLDEFELRASMNVSDTAHGGLNLGGSAILNAPAGITGSAVRLVAFYQDDDG